MSVRPRPPARGAQHGQDASWLEPEELAYSSPTGSPSGSRRRAYALCEDGQYRTIRVGVADTYFSIPGFTTFHGHRVNGYVAYTDGRFVFHAYRGGR